MKSQLEKELDEIRGVKEKFRITELASALRGFARQFRIEGIPRHAPREFLQNPEINERKSTDEGQDDSQL